MLMNIILWIVFGAIAGWIASIIMKTDAQQGSIMNIVVGIVGAIVGGWVMNFFGGNGGVAVTGFNQQTFTSLLVAVLGAVILLAVVKMLRKA